MSGRAFLLDTITSSWKTRAICVACQLGIPDELGESRWTSKELSDRVGIPAESVDRLLSGLASIGLCTQLDASQWELTEYGKPLAASHPDSLKQWAIWWGHYCWPIWGELQNSLRTGQSGREKLYGTAGFDHLEADHAAATCFHGAMSELTRLATDSVIAGFSFEKYDIVADIGGGNGQLLRSILLSNPGARGILFDRLETVRDLEADTLPGIEIHPGDFFESVPGDADLYILKSVLHDWPDPQAEQILKNCRSAMKKSAMLLIIDRVGPEEIEVSREHQDFFRSDLHMLVALGAKERTRAELEELLARTGFEVLRIEQIGFGMSFLECKPKMAERTNEAHVEAT